MSQVYISLEGLVTCCLSPAGHEAEGGEAGGQRHASVLGYVNMAQASKLHGATLSLAPTLGALSVLVPHPTSGRLHGARVEGS